MAEWLGAVPALLWAVALSVGPGAPIALALRVRGYLLLPVAIAASFAATGVASILASLARLDWSPGHPFVVGLLIGGLLLIGWGRFRPPSRWSARHRLREWTVPLIALAVAATMALFLARQGLINPDTMAQNYDNVFHLNAVRYILDTGSASPFDMQMASSEATFYPTLWHGTVANIVALSGSTIPIATNALILVSNAVVWPAGAIALSRVLFGAGASMTLSAGICSSAFTAFPFLLAPWTALYPNLLAIALLPTALAGAVAALGLGREHVAPAAGFRGSLVALGAMGAASLAQPNTFFAFGLMLLPAAVVALVRLWRRGIGLTHRILASAALLAGTAGFVFAWSRIRTGDNFTEYDRGGVEGALIDALTNAPHLGVNAWTITILVALGIWSSLRQGINRWWLFAYASVVVLYTSAAGLPDSPLRDLITQIWYNDAYRLAGFLPVGALPFAALGLASVFRLLQYSVLLRRRDLSRRRLRTSVVAVTGVAALLTLAGTQGTQMHLAIDEARWIHDVHNGTPAVDDDEEALFEELDELVPEDAVIAGSPANGASLAYALSNREVLFPHFEGNSDPSAWVLARHLKDGGAEVCAAADHLGVEYVLDFGSQFLPAPEYRLVKYPGLTDVSSSPILTEIAAVGEARLFEITGCG